MKRSSRIEIKKIVNLHLRLGVVLLPRFLLVFTDIAQAAPARLDDAAVAAKIAFYFMIIQSFIKISFHKQVSYPAIAPVEGLAWQEIAKGLVLKRGTSVTTMPAKAPNGHRWVRLDRSIREASSPEPRGK